jgi:hypothetical protein
MLARVRNDALLFGMVGCGLRDLHNSDGKSTLIRLLERRLICRIRVYRDYSLGPTARGLVALGHPIANPAPPKPLIARTGPTFTNHDHRGDIDP